MHHLNGYSQTRYKLRQSFIENRIRQERSESAREWRIALYKSDQQQQIFKERFWKKVSLKEHRPIMYVMLYIEEVLLCMCLQPRLFQRHWAKRNQ